MHLTLQNDIGFTAFKVGIFCVSTENLQEIQQWRTPILPCKTVS